MCLSDGYKIIREHNTVGLWLLILGLHFTIHIYPGITKFQHPRLAQPILVSSLLIGLILTVKFNKIIKQKALYYLLILFAIYLTFAIYSIKNVPFPETLPISNMKKIIREGRYTNFNKVYPKKPFYILSTPGRISWGRLNISNFLDQYPPKFKDAYAYSNQLLKLPLIEKEKIEILLEQVLILLILGDTKKALEVFEEKIDSDDKDLYCEILNLESQFCEKQGKFKEARQKMLSAINKFDNNEGTQQAKIYNNLARMEMMLGNSTNTLHYYRKSVSIARKLNDKGLLHTIYPNLIDTYLLNGLYGMAQRELNNYKGFIETANVYDHLRFINYQMTYSRQISDTEMMLGTLEQINNEIYPELPSDQQLILKSNELRIRWNLNYKWDEILSWIEDHLSEYQNLPFPDNYYTLKEAYNILFDLAKVNKVGEFRKLFSKLIVFMGEIKADISQYIISIPDYCVNERCNWEYQLVFLSKVRRANKPNITLIDFHKRNFKHMSNIKDISLEHNNPLFAIKADMDIAEECMGGIRGTTNQDVIGYLKNTMLEHMDSVYKEIGNFEKKPQSFSFLIRISMYSLYLGDIERSKQYFNKFEESNININHYSKWIKDYYIFLKKYFNAHT